MNGKIFKVLFALLISALFVCAPSFRADAEMLATYEKTLTKYQSSPLERSKALERELNKIRSVEAGLARQNGIALSRVLAHELTIDDTIDLYRSIYYIQQRNTGRNVFILGDDKVDEIIKTEPPYTFMFYIDLVNAVNDCRTFVEKRRKGKEENKTELVQNSKHRIALEKEYRLLNSSSFKMGEAALLQTWKIQENMAKLEYNFANQMFLLVAIAANDEELNLAMEKLKLLEPVLVNVRKNVKVNTNDESSLTADINTKYRQLSDVYKMLKGKYREFKTIEQNLEVQSQFTKFWLPSEQYMVENEILFVLDLLKDWPSLRIVWASLQDMIDGDLSIDEQKTLLGMVDEIITQADSDISFCDGQLQAINNCELEAAKRFPADTADLSGADAQRYNEFIVNINARKKRYLTYIIDIGMIRTKFMNLRSETMDIMDLNPTQVKVSSYWKDSVGAVMNYELWHFDDFPVTLRKLINALLIFAVVFLLSLYLSHLLRRRLRNRKELGQHNTQLMVKLITYIGFIIALLCALWSLNIPFAAFALTGGAVAIAFGLGAQRLMGDVFSGLLMLFHGRLHIGDEIVIDGQRGIIKEISLLNTIILCEQSKNLIIPNNKMLSSDIINLTLDDASVRTEVPVSISYDSDMQEAMGTMRGILSDNERVLKSPPFKILMEDFGDNGIKLTAQFFINIRNNFERDVQSSVRQQILDAFAAKGIKIPFPQAEIKITSEKK